MSILVKGMEMPNSCGNCPLRRSNENRVWCYKLGEYIDFNKEFDGRKNNCPLTEVPPHGTLVDADALIADLVKYQDMLDPESREYARVLSVKSYLTLARGEAVIEAEE